MTDQTIYGDVEIPKTALVRCPMRLGAFIYARTCDACPHCAGLTHAFNNPKLRFEQQYMIRCKFPVDREMVTFEG